MLGGHISPSSPKPYPTIPTIGQSVTSIPTLPTHSPPTLITTTPPPLLLQQPIDIFASFDFSDTSSLPFSSSPISPKMSPKMTLRTFSIHSRSWSAISHLHTQTASTSSNRRNLLFRGKPLTPLYPATHIVKEFPSYAIALRAIELKSTQLIRESPVTINWSNQADLKKSFYNTDHHERLAIMHPYAARIVGFFMTSRNEESEVDMDLEALKIQIMTDHLLFPIPKKKTNKHAHQPKDFISTHENMLSFLSKVDPNHIKTSSYESDQM
ncbi:hypothetical protein BC829DRAFT_413340 [Chytridium lagenaria]|nr:hypothetical protein BC829DRAFT_413340 [Chytridium lagenaria]